MQRWSGHSLGYWMAVRKRILVIMAPDLIENDVNCGKDN